MKKLTLFTVLATAIFLFSNCKSEPKQPAEPVESDKLGTLHFTVTGSEEAMPHFEKGLKLLHNFEFDDSADEFLKAQELDSAFVMAYWGEAMTYNHPLWRQQDFEKGQTALAKLADTPEARAALAQTELERDFLQGMEIMYGPEGTKKERDSMYSKHMEILYDKYPGNEEVAAFYALSLLGAVPMGRDVEAYEKSARVVEGVIAENPDHPGALHYLIHSYDDPGHAPQALNAAFRYSEVAADATHALHMPSHIFVAVGMWDEVIKSNIASWEASARRVKEKGIENSAGSYHALHWLMYGQLQKGRTEEARQLMLDMKKYADEMPTKNARDYLVSMKGNYLVETGDWGSEIADFDCQRNDLNVATQAIHFFCEGRKALFEKNAQGIQAAIDSIAEIRKSAANLVTERGLAMCSPNSNFSAPNQLDIDQAKVMELELRALKVTLSDRDKVAEKWLRQAAKLESEISYSYGPPVIVQPTYELYGEWLMTWGRADDAAKQFDKALEKGPKRQAALRGRLNAAKLMGETKKIQELEATLAEVLGDGREQS